MRYLQVGVGLLGLLPVSIWAQRPSADSGIPQQKPSLQITSRAVLVDVVVTNSSGRPVTGLSRGAFSVTEQGKSQMISYFEENGRETPQQPLRMPTLPHDTFTNFSPFPQPPAVNVLLLDSLNTRMESQSDVHRQALDFLKSARPGTRSAIFGMGLTLRFIQGFNDDPAVLAAALENKKNMNVENPVMLKSQSESNAQERVVAMGAVGLAHLFAEMDSVNEDDRKLITLGNLQRLAVFLRGFPGRKNVIWFTERPPGVFNPGGSTGDPAVEDEIKKTLAMLGEARAALYPVDARGTSVNAQYTAENNPAVISTNGEALRNEEMERNTDQLNAQIMAEESGGRAFANTNGLSDVIGKLTSDSSYFYTLSYSPPNMKMDGGFRKIEVKVAGGKYKLLYRRGYYAVDADSPSGWLAKRMQKLTGQDTGATDPLIPHMEPGMPQNQQILYKVQILDAAQAKGTGTDDKEEEHYALNFAIHLDDLNLVLDSEGLHKGTLKIALIIFDRYGNIVRQQNHAIGLNIKPDIYTMFLKTGVQLHFELAVPKGNYWLRSGIFDERSHKVGTLEIPLAAVKPLETALDVKGPGERGDSKRTAPHLAQTASSRLLTVQQMEQSIEELHVRSDKEAVRKLAKLKLRERLNLARLDELQGKLPGEQSRLALLAIAAISAFRDPSSADVDPHPAPDQAAQKQILSRAADYVLTTTERMPNFFAQKKVVRFTDATSGLGINFAVVTPGFYRLVDTRAQTVHFRGGREESEDTGDTVRKRPQEPAPGLVTSGIFGPMLQTVMQDILKGAIGWSRWEISPAGSVAVFRYTVPKDQATFTVTWCCSFQTPGSDTYRQVQLIPAYHGEISVDPESGTVTRFTVIADLNPGGMISVANVMVEYGPVEIAGRTYQCPIRSATVLVAKSFIVHQDRLEIFDTTSVSDTRFDQYHVFRSEMRILEH